VRGLDTSHQLAHEVAALTPGDPAARSATAHAVALIGQCLAHRKTPVRDPQAAGVREHCGPASRSLVKADSYLTTEEQWRIDAALQGAENRPADLPHDAKPLLASVR
jgi:hypothetical protein